MKKILTLVGVVFVSVAVASFNQWYRISNIVNLHTEAAKSVRQSLVQKGMRPVSWALSGQTGGAFESVPSYPDEVKALDGKQITIVGYGIPLGGDAPVEEHNHTQASMLPSLPILDLVLDIRIRPTTRGAPVLDTVATGSYWKKRESAMTSERAGGCRGRCARLRGKLELREQEGLNSFRAQECRADQ